MSSATIRFEVIGDLYCRKHHRLRPGMYEASITGRDANTEENRTQFDQWFATRAFTDAIDRIAELEAQLEEITAGEDI